MIRCVIAVLFILSTVSGGFAAINKHRNITTCISGWGIDRDFIAEFGITKDDRKMKVFIRFTSASPLSVDGDVIIDTDKVRIEQFVERQSHNWTVDLKYNPMDDQINMLALLSRSDVMNVTMPNGEKYNFNMIHVDLPKCFSQNNT